jgi:quinol monooxygenase YgiN
MTSTWQARHDAPGSSSVGATQRERGAMSVNVVANFHAADGKADELRLLLEQGRDISRAATGCEHFELYQRQDDPHKFMFFEQWTSIEAHHENMASGIVGSGHLAKIIPLLVGSVDNGVIDRL